MKLKNVLAVLLLVASVQVFGQNTADLQRLPNGAFYKIYTSSTAPKIKLNDVITFHFIQKTDKDSVLASSYQMGRPATVPVQPARNIADLMDFFQLLAVKDSALVKVPTDSIFKGPEAEAGRPPFLPKGSYLTFIIKVEKVQTMDEAMAEYQKEMDKMKSDELVVLNRYVADNSLKPTTTSSGLKYFVTKSSVKPKPVNGDTVLVNYIGSTLEGKVFDSSIEAEAKKAGLEQPGRNYEPISLVLGQGQVIKGWEEGLLMLNEGAKATFLIPSDLGYGPQGAGNDIKPFSSLRFDLELVKVKKAKKAPATTSPTIKKTTPVKKPATPAKKPVAPAKKPVAPVKKPTTSSTAKPSK
ncbi:FKBP-type peptidyl-prolyl cis-trans isomerase [Desertivirga xinjiangensis]|uniref:FKBP-type peptidyl-prolyl cis-trans isomerase n=1 Tax=Desertivirga xinjiangensis TaxID=539206 RepID=UPI00210B07AD|nr:FKBP-type peptidyl-prolyl cis-trans isomerase [Pedobacter xinjiangensis]